MTQSTLTQVTTIWPVPVVTTPDVRACPECRRPALVVDRFTLDSTDGPVEHVRLSCAGGRHHLTLITQGHRS